METEHDPERLRALLSDLIQAIQFAKPDLEDDFYHCPVKGCPGSWDESPIHPHAPDCALIAALRALEGLKNVTVSTHDHCHMNVMGWQAVFGADDMGEVVGVHPEDRTVDVWRFKTGEVKVYPFEWEEWGVDPLISNFNLSWEDEAEKFRKAKTAAVTRAR